MVPRNCHPHLVPSAWGHRTSSVCLCLYGCLSLSVCLTRRERERDPIYHLQQMGYSSHTKNYVRDHIISSSPPGFPRSARTHQHLHIQGCCHGIKMRQPQPEEASFRRPGVLHLSHTNARLHLTSDRVILSLTECRSSPTLSASVEMVDSQTGESGDKWHSQPPESAAFMDSVVDCFVRDGCR